MNAPRPFRVSLLAFLSYVTLLAVGMGSLRWGLQTHGTPLKPFAIFAGLVFIVGSLMMPMGYWRSGLPGALEWTLLSFMALLLAVWSLAPLFWWL